VYAVTVSLRELTPGTVDLCSCVLTYEQCPYDTLAAKQDSGVRLHHTAGEAEEQDSGSEEGDGEREGSETLNPYSPRMPCSKKKRETPSATQSCSARLIHSTATAHSCGE